MDKEKVIKAYECCKNSYDRRCDKCPYEKDCCHDGMPMFVIKKMVALLKEQEAVVHPEPSCEMTYITNCCCDLCGVQLIREDNFCRCCGKRIEWEGR